VVVALTMANEMIGAMGRGGPSRRLLFVLG
jgi:hypothetical protein